MIGINRRQSEFQFQCIADQMTLWAKSPSYLDPASPVVWDLWLTKYPIGSSPTLSRGLMRRNASDPRQHLALRQMSESRELLMFDYRMCGFFWDFAFGFRFPETPSHISKFLLVHCMQSKLFSSFILDPRKNFALRYINPW